MPRIESLRVQHVRIHTDRELEFAPATTVITGSNGVGKTSIIEALYIALQGKSFRGVDGDVLARNQSWYRIDAVFTDDMTRIVKFDSQKAGLKKQFTIDGKVSYRLPSRLKYPVVLFEPDDLRLLAGSPTRRRFFIDHMIGQIDEQYQITTRKYDRALKQRNSLLKRPYASDDELFAWNVALSEYGAEIMAKRVQYIERLNTKLENRYRLIAGTDDMITVHYSHTLIGDIRQKMFGELVHNAARDKQYGFTSTGPHRHDVVFRFNDSAAAPTASRGEVRSAVLALKFIEAELIDELSGKPPLILLDDVYSELDTDRQKRLQNSEGPYQIIITTTNARSSKRARIIALK